MDSYVKYTHKDASEVIEEMKKSSRICDLYPNVKEVNNLDDFLVKVLGLKEVFVLTTLSSRLLLVVEPLIDLMIVELGGVNNEKARPVVRLRNIYREILK